MNTPRIRKEFSYSVRCPKCFDWSSITFDAEPFLDKDYIYCPRCGEKVEA